MNSEISLAVKEFSELFTKAKSCADKLDVIGYAVGLKRKEGESLVDFHSRIDLSLERLFGHKLNLR